MTGWDRSGSDAPADGSPVDRAPADGSPADRPPGGGHPHENRIRDRYLEFDVESATVGLIVDPTNQDAWIMSDRPRRVDS